MNFIDKLNKLLEEKNMRVSDLSRASGVPYTTIKGLFDKNYENMKLATLLAITKALDVSIDYLVLDDYKERACFLDRDAADVVEKYSQLDMPGKKSVRNELEKQSERMRKSAENGETFIMLPFYEDKAAAGSGYMLGAGEHTMVRVRSSRKTDRADFIVTVSGASMEPEYDDGECVLVQSQPDVYEGEIGIFTVNGNGFIKKKGKDRLISLNHKFRDIFINEDDNVTCAGKVVGKLEPEEIM